MYGYNYFGRKEFYDEHKIDPIYLNKSVNLNSSVNKIKNEWNNFKNDKITTLVKDLNQLLS